MITMERGFGSPKRTLRTLRIASFVVFFWSSAQVIDITVALAAKKGSREKADGAEQESEQNNLQGGVGGVSLSPSIRQFSVVLVIIWALDEARRTVIPPFLAVQWSISRWSVPIPG